MVDRSQAKVLYVIDLWVNCFADILRAEILNMLQFIKDMFIGLTTKSGYVQAINFLYCDVKLTLPTTILLFILIEWFGRKNHYAIEILNIKTKPLARYTFYYIQALKLFYLLGKSNNLFIFSFKIYMKDLF